MSSYPFVHVLTADCTQSRADSSDSTFQLLFYAIRPGFIRTQKPTVWHGINIATILFSDYLLVHFFGWKPLVYLLFSSLFAGSLHPCAAHFIAEHYLMNGPKNEAEGVEALAQETTSYYGWLNILCYNVGSSSIPIRSDLFLELWEEGTYC